MSATPGEETRDDPEACQGFILQPTYRIESNRAVVHLYGKLASGESFLIRDDRGKTLVYHILADSASAPYLWKCLIDAMAEFDGGPVGLAQLLAYG